MRKSYLFAAALCAVVLAGCSQDEHLDFVNDGKSNFTGKMETLDSRTSLDENNKVVWTEGDEVSIFEGDNANSLYKVNGITDGIANFEYVSYIDPTNWEDLNPVANYAVYPYSEDNSIAADGTISVIIPTQYTFKDKASSIEDAVMAAKSTTTQLNFINTQGIFRLRLNANKPAKYGKIQSIKLTSKANKLTGTATISFAGTTTPSAVITGTGAGQELTINLDESIELPLSTDGKYAEFYVPVVPTDFAAEDLTLTVVGENNTYTYVIKPAFSIGRKVIKGIKHTLGANNYSGGIDGETTEAWDGETKESVSEDNGVYLVTKASQLAWIADQVNSKINTFSGKTIKLGADIDLGNQDWTPIGQTGVSGFGGTFDGNNKTIYNLQIDNMDVVGEYGAAGLFGWVEQHSGSNNISNLIIDGVTIRSHRYSGAIAGWINIPVINCIVKNVNIDCSYYNDDTDGTKVGSLVGYADNGVDANLCVLQNNVVENAKIYAYGDVGGLAGVAQTKVSVDGNKVKNVTINYLSTAKSIAGEVVSTRVTPSLGSNNVEDVIINLQVSNAEELQKAIKNGGNIVLANDITVDEWIMFSETLSIGDGRIITVDKIDVTIDGNSHTLTINGIESAGNGNQLFHSASNLNIHNLTIKYADGLSVGGIGLKSGIIRKVNFVGGGVAVHPGDGEIKIEECEFATNATAIYFEEERDNLTVIGCSFNQPNDVNVILLRGDVEFKDNKVYSGRTVNIVSGSPIVTGNNFNNVRLKVYSAATATISDNYINNLAFEDNATTYASTFTNNTLSVEAQAALDAMNQN